MVEKVVIAGFNARNVVRSARMAGWEVISLARYCDEDLKLYSSKSFCFLQPDLDKLVALCQNYRAPVLLSTGFEYFLNELRRKVDVLGSFNPVCLDKLRFARELERAGIDTPETKTTPDIPGKIVVKKRFGGGGVDSFLISGGDNLDKRVGGEYIFQEFVEGKPVSAIVISDGRDARCLSINEILSGWKQMNAKDFLYSGNITPFTDRDDRDVCKKIARIAESVAILFDVRGCCGVDLILSSDGIYVLELNPRIPGSLDSFEMSTGKNLFAMHVKAADGAGISAGVVEEVRFERYALRAVYYARSKLRAYIPPASPFFADIPGWGEEIERGSPVTSIISTGSSRDEVVSKALSRKMMLENEFLKLM